MALLSTRSILISVMSARLHGKEHLEQCQMRRPCDYVMFNTPLQCSVIQPESVTDFPPVILGHRLYGTGTPTTLTRASFPRTHSAYTVRFQRNMRVKMMDIPQKVPLRLFRLRLSRDKKPGDPGLGRYGEGCAGAERG